MLRQLRNEIIRFMPPWMNTESKLLDYMDMSAFTVVQKTDALYVDGTPYLYTTTLGELKTALSIAGTGDYDVCVIDIIEKIDGTSTWIETNTNFIWLDAIIEAVIEIIEYKIQAIREMNPLLATSDFGVPYWEAMFSSERQIILGVPETDPEYMLRVLGELFSMTTSLININNLLLQIGLQPFTFINTRKDTFQWNNKMWPYSVSLHLDKADSANIDFIRRLFTGASAAGTRLFIFCPDETLDCYGLYYATDADDYIPPSRFIPGGPIPSIFDLETNSGNLLVTNSGYTIITN